MIVADRSSSSGAKRLHARQSDMTAHNNRSEGEEGAVPRPDLTPHLVTVPLSVTATAERLGISPSTLRTWERRYGLGPSERELGSRRRYSVADVEILETVVKLVKSGVPLSEAARSVKEARALMSHTDEAITPDDLVNHARESDYQEVCRLIDVLMTRHGLLHTWTDYVGPAMAATRTIGCGVRRGAVPRTMLTLATLAAVKEVAQQSREHACDAPDACPVIIVTDDAKELHAHLVGVSLQWEGVETRIITVAPVPADDHGSVTASIIEDVRACRQRSGAHAIICLGSIVENPHLIAAFEADARYLVLVGRHRCATAGFDATRVSSLPACVEETIQLMRHCHD